MAQKDNLFCQPNNKQLPSFRPCQSKTFNKTQQPPKAAEHFGTNVALIAKWRDSLKE